MRAVCICIYTYLWWVGHLQFREADGGLSGGFNVHSLARPKGLGGQHAHVEQQDVGVIQHVGLILAGTAMGKTHIEQLLDLSAFTETIWTTREWALVCGSVVVMVMLY